MLQTLFYVLVHGAYFLCVSQRMLQTLFRFLVQSYLVPWYMVQTIVFSDEFQRLVMCLLTGKLVLCVYRGEWYKSSGPGVWCRFVLSSDERCKRRPVT